ncbi:MAG: hypothetical protein NC390_02150 [Fusobacterium sp.]|nr:hypothetical protein [Fusobacterium sp.]
MLKELDKKALIKYFRSLGLEVNTSTAARGHQGFFLKNRIDISKNVSEERFIPTLLHEFAHFIHSRIEPDLNRSGGTLEKIFNSSNPFYEKELIRVTQFVDESSRLVKLYEMRDKIRVKIKQQELIIKEDYPEFQRSKPFKPFDKYIRKSDARYLLKYDRVKITGGFWHAKTRVITIDTIEKDFPDMPEAFAACIRLKSLQRKGSRVSARINRYKKYYERPAELFARLVEGLYIDEEWVCALAPQTTEKFYELLEKGYYAELKDIIKKD